MEQERRENRRQCFRVEYPLSYRPEILLNNGKYRVVDLSEGGIKFFSRGNKLEVGAEVLSKLIFHDKRAIGNLKGKVLRVEDDHVVISLEEKIPLRKIREQDIYVINKRKDLVKY